MTAQQVTVRVAKDGRLSLPAAQRAVLGVEHGGTLLMQIEDGEVRLRTLKSVVAEAQALTAKYLTGRGETVERFIAEKREEAARER